MTGAENERLAIVETKVTTLVSDVAEIKTDVKTLLAARSRAIGAGELLIRGLPFVALGVSLFALFGAH